MSTSRSISHFKIGEISADLQPRTTQVFWSSSTRCQTTCRRYSRPNQLAGGLFRLIPPLSYLGLGYTVFSFPSPVIGRSSPSLWFICGGTWPRWFQSGTDRCEWTIGLPGSILIGMAIKGTKSITEKQLPGETLNSRISLPHWRLGVNLWPLPPRSILTRR